MPYWVLQLIRRLVFPRMGQLIGFYVIVFTHFRDIVYCTEFFEFILVILDEQTYYYIKPSVNQ